MLSLDEYDEKRLWEELARRHDLQRQGLCDYCGYRAGVSLKIGVAEKYAGHPDVEKYVARASDGPCKCSERHNSPSNIKRIDPADFRKAGYLQELNRRFLHPLGLALEIVVEDNGLEHLGGVWDYRDDPEGINYGEHDPEQSQIMQERARHIDACFEERSKARIEGLSYVVQPIDKL